MKSFLLFALWSVPFMGFSQNFVNIIVKKASDKTALAETSILLRQKGSASDLRMALTDQEGKASFFAVDTLSGELELLAEKSSPSSITTFDLAQNFPAIKAHVNGTKPFTEPWQYVAADADQNGKIELADVIACRSYILGITPLDTWRFYPETHVFPPNDPLSQPVPSAYTFNQASIPQQALVFLGVEMCALDNVVLSTHEWALQLADLSPNPSNGAAFFSCYLPENEGIDLKIMDASGKMVYQQKHSGMSGNVRIEIPSMATLQAGIYVWVAQSGKYNATGKWIKN